MREVSVGVSGCQGRWAVVGMAGRGQSGSAFICLRRLGVARRRSNTQLSQASVIPKTLKMGVVPACMVLMMKWGPRNITGWPGVSIM